MFYQPVAYPPSASSPLFLTPILVLGTPSISHPIHSVSGSCRSLALVSYDSSRWALVLDYLQAVELRSFLTRHLTTRPRLIHISLPSRKQPRAHSEAIIKTNTTKLAGRPPPPPLDDLLSIVSFCFRDKCHSYANRAHPRAVHEPCTTVSSDLQFGLCLGLPSRQQVRDTIPAVKIVSNTSQSPTSIFFSFVRIGILRCRDTSQVSSAGRVRT